MSPTLAYELAGLIIDELWAAKDIRTVCSLSLVSKSFTAPCQGRLWRTVFLHSVGRTYQSRISLMQAKIVLNSPHIGGYVRSLNLQVVSPETRIAQEQREDLDCYGRALKLMPNIHELKMAFECPHNNWLSFTAIPDLLRETVVQIVASGGLRRLALAKLASFPFEALKVSLGHLERLELLRFVEMKSDFRCVFTSRDNPS